MYNPYNYPPANNDYYNQQQQQPQQPNSSFNYQPQQQPYNQNQQPQYYGNVQQQQPMINNVNDPYGNQQQQMNSYVSYPTSNQVAGSYYPNQQQPMTQHGYQTNSATNQYSYPPQPQQQYQNAQPSYPPQVHGNVPYQNQQPSYSPQSQPQYQQNSQPSYGAPSQPQQAYNTTVQPQYTQQQSYGCFPQNSQVIDQSQYLYLQNYEQFYAQQKSQQPLHEPFVDPDFPPNETSLGFSKKKIKENNYGGFKRAAELCENPQLFIDGIDARDIKQGSLGDCWLLSSLAAIARFPHLIAHLFVRANVAMGQYTLRFFWRNEWKYITVDDFVPITTDGEIMVVKSKDSNELWPTIVEKAIAKLFGSYTKVEGGDGTLGIYLFTGCLPQFEDLRNHVSCIEEDNEEEEYDEDADEDEEQDEEEQGDEEEAAEEAIIGGGLSFDEIWCCIVNGFNNGNAIGFGSDDNTGLGDEYVDDSGIVGGHYYALLDCLEYKGHKLVRLRNPWGNTEWKGAWSDVSKEMTAQAKRDLNERVTEQANLIQQLCGNTGLLPVNDTANDRKSRKQREKEEQDDGVFWMELGDAINHFGTMAIGHIVNIDHLFKEDNAFGLRFDQHLLRAIHKSSTFPLFKQILKHDDKDYVGEDENGCKTLTQQFSLTVDRKCDTLIALRMIHNDMLKYNSYLELVCDELDIKSTGLYVFTGTRRNVTKGQHTFQVHSESRNSKFSDIEVTLLWENRQAHINLNEQEVEFEEYDEE